MSKFSHPAAIVLFLLPLFVDAAGGGLITVIDLFTTIFTTLVPILIGVAVVVFLWGIVKFISHADDEREREGGKQFMIWSLVALFVMVSLWSIVGFIQESLLPTSGGSLGALPVQPDTVPTP